MIVTIKPPNREEYQLTVNGLVQFSSVRNRGYASATVPCLYSDEERLHFLGARVRVHGKTGIVWQGIVIRRPVKGAPLEAQGWGWAGSLGRRTARYCDTNFLGSLKDYNGTNWSIFERSVEGGTVMVAQRANTTGALNDQAGLYLLGSTPVTKMTFTATVSYSKMKLYIIGLDANGSVLGTPYEKTSVSTETGQSITFAANTYGVLIRGILTDSTTPADTSIYVSISSVKLYGPSVTSVTIHNVVDDIITNEIATTFNPSGAAYLAWVDADATVIEPLVFESSDANTKLDGLAKYVAAEYGWYMERVAGIPYCVFHWTARPTTPHYILPLREAEDDSLDECSLDELVSVMRVHYTDTNGRARYIDVTDTNATHPLVKLGLTRYADAQASTASSTTATTAGTVGVADAGRQQVKGSVTTRVLYDANGREVYLPDVRPGRIVRVTGYNGGYVDARIESAECAEDDLVTLTLDNDPYRLDILLARLEKRE